VERRMAVWWRVRIDGQHRNVVRWAEVIDDV
jgi:hypothetical protein